MGVHHSVVSGVGGAGEQHSEMAKPPVSLPSWLPHCLAVLQTLHASTLSLSGCLSSLVSLFLSFFLSSLLLISAPLFLPLFGTVYLELTRKRRVF